MKAHTLDGHWQFRIVNSNTTLPDAARRATDWLPATVPGTVHTDLMANGIIPDPYFRMQEHDVQWVDQERWLYRTTIELPPEFLRERVVRLRAEGLDTYAEVRVNGTLVGRTENMFVEHLINVKRALRPGANTIEVLFDSPVVRAKALEKKYGALRVALEPHRVYARKAQYSFSWDWGPKLTTSGIWRPIRLEAFSAPVLKDPFVNVLSLKGRQAMLRISADIEGSVRPGMTFSATIVGEEIGGTSSVRGRSGAITVRLPKAALWWPNGQGEQPMYTAHLELRRGTEVVDERDVPFAVRTVKLLQERDAEGRSFQFVVNGRTIFCKGADWIPADNFLPRVPDSRYQALLQKARDAHMNMLRVWGGGVYEDDRFYDLCDRMGLLVWQDFMFACGEYPAQAWFAAAVRKEAEGAVKRLRNHPSIALWCGNNECEWLFCMENPGKHPDQMRGAAIFRDVLRTACKMYDGTRPYWRSSPFGRGFPNDESNGNHHQWQVWSAWKHFSAYTSDRGRFVTEFGFQAPATVQTMEECTLPEDRDPQSMVMEHHNKQIEGPERLMRFVSAHHRVETEWRRFTYLAQLVQAEALKTAVEHWRRRKFKTAGALFWQINDCWPVASWSVIDSGLRPKAGYFYAKRFFAPLLVSLRPAGPAVEVWVTNDLPRAARGTVNVSRRTFAGGVAWERECPVSVPANSSRRVARIDGERLRGIAPATEYLLAAGRGEDLAGAENRHFFSPPKHWKLPEPGVGTSAARMADGVVGVSVTSSTFVKDLYLNIEGGDAELDDNFFDVEAGGSRTVSIHTRRDPADIAHSMTIDYVR